MATRWRLHFIGQPHPFRQWLSALVFVYSLATVEQTYKVFRHSLNGHVSVLLLLATGLFTYQETFGRYWYFHFAPLVCYQLYVSPYSLSASFCLL